MRQGAKQHSIWLLTPVFGTLVFVIIYIAATLLYPGGSQVDKNATGFDWFNNYWCNLLNQYAINGQQNPARPIAITGLLVLSLSLTAFWFGFSRYSHSRKVPGLIIRLSGTTAMIISLLLFTDMDHDLVTNLASGFGLIATLTVLIVLYKMKWYGLLIFGIFNLLLVAGNNYLYYHEELIVYLPFVQKVSFAAFLLWICCITICLYKR
ncbi:hypothetical protein ACFS6H_13260 [Terrimonas rubra]|uniref:DUF998 domain-containing protein n=1 Tax=Terrimonas rubra TaxID=1035890 RepID=A0ABW6A7T5_9BACT